MTCLDPAPSPPIQRLLAPSLWIIRVGQEHYRGCVRPSFQRTSLFQVSMITYPPLCHILNFKVPLPKRYPSDVDALMSVTLVESLGDRYRTSYRSNLHELYFTTITAPSHRFRIPTIVSWNGVHNSQVRMQNFKSTEEKEGEAPVK